MDNQRSFKSTVRLVLSIVAVIAVLVIGLNSVKNVPVNNVGVKYSNVKGTVVEEPLAPGLHFKTPFIEKITALTTELRAADIDDVQITTQDGQTITVDIELQYRVLPENAIKTFKNFKRVPESDWIDVFVFQLIQDGIQTAASDYTVIEIMGAKRGLFKKDVDEAVKVAMEMNDLTIHATGLDDIQASDAIKKSIEENAKAKQDVETARQIKAKNEVENETKVEKATADSEVKTIDAEAEANANKKIQESVGDNLIDYMEAQARQSHGWYKYKNMEPNIVADEE